MNHPIQTTLLPHLNGVRRAPTTSKTRGAWRASCPLHHKKNEDLSIAVGNDGGPLLFCHCRHKPDEVLAELGLSWPDLYPRVTDPAMPGKGNGGPSAWVSLAAAVDELLKAHARLLACVQGGQLVDGLEAMIDAGKAAELVKQIARRAMREGK